LFFSSFTRIKPLVKKRLPGGILADEMGLGKTLEILGCLLINRRTEFLQHTIEPDHEQININNKNMAFSCLCGKL
jgi:SNF2 family DNA or RNA helicase